VGILLVTAARLGSYLIHEETPPAGYEPGLDQNVNLTSSAKLTVTFTNKLGSIEIKKLDELGNVINLPGATFTIQPNPYGTETLTVVDNDANDKNSAYGIILLEAVSLGTYTITETVAPSGYKKDPKPKTVNITSATVTVAFINKLSSVNR